MRDEVLRKVLPVVVLFAAFVAAVPAAAAQGSEGQVALPEGAVPEINQGSLYSGPYEVTADGDLIYGGDVVYGCESLPKFAALARAERGAERDAAQEASFEEAIGLCAAAGFPSEGASAKAPGGSDVVGALPHTGGLASPASLAFVSAALAIFAALALLLRR